MLLQLQIDYEYTCGPLGDTKAIEQHTAPRTSNRI